ncbi:MAG: hypothetical protein FNNCIFGK_02247 [Bacteroidia bacterium]|nr:hypothetical protein [Bacteroidia bacterium]
MMKKMSILTVQLIAMEILMVQHSSTVVEHVLEETPVSQHVHRIATEFGVELHILIHVTLVLVATPV